MDILLDTKTSDPSLSFLDIQTFENYGYETLLVVRSGWVSATFEFMFQEPRNFLRDLTRLNATLAGEAVLGPIYEEHYVRLAGNGIGGISVQGHLIYPGPQVPARQSIHFRFETDQTVLPQLIRDFETLIG